MEPVQFSLAQNYPNPFNSATVIFFNVKERCRVRFLLHNVSGQYVRTLEDRDYLPGLHRLTVDASGLCSGIYFYQIQMGDFREIRKMIIME